MQIIKQISNWGEVKNYLNSEIKPLTTPERAKCALGRKNIWLQAEPNYSTKKYKPAHSDPRLWAFIQKLFPEAALAQIYFADRQSRAVGDRGIGIDWHRDASYAEARGRIFNMGVVTLQTKMRSGELISLNLTGGELIEFDTKLLHRAINPHPDRVGIGMWIDKIAIDDPHNWE